MGERIRTGILVFDDVEVLDFCGPFEVFSVTRQNPDKRREEPSPFEVFLVAERRAPVRATGGLSVNPDYSIDDHPPIDLLVVPGGWGTRKEVKNERLIRWIAKVAGQARLMSSVCTGAFLLAEAGLLKGQTATTHWASTQRMRDTYPDITVLENVRSVDHDKVVTSAGISAGIDSSLRIVRRNFGEAVAAATARHMEYEGNWR